MVLEATMVCVDNSEWMRNADFAPTRFEVREGFGDRCITCSSDSMTNDRRCFRLLKNSITCAWRAFLDGSCKLWTLEVDAALGRWPLKAYDLPLCPPLELPID